MVTHLQIFWKTNVAPQGQWLFHTACSFRQTNPAGAGLSLQRFTRLRENQRPSLKLFLLLMPLNTNCRDIDSHFLTVATLQEASKTLKEKHGIFTHSTILVLQLKQAANTLFKIIIFSHLAEVKPTNLWHSRVFPHLQSCLGHQVFLPAVGFSSR